MSITLAPRSTFAKGLTFRQIAAALREEAHASVGIIVASQLARLLGLGWWRWRRRAAFLVETYRTVAFGLDVARTAIERSVHSPHVRGILGAYSSTPNREQVPCPKE